MAKYKRWFPVSHDINADPEMITLTDKFGLLGLQIWLEILSVTDRNEGVFPGTFYECSTALVRRLNGRRTKVERVLNHLISIGFLTYNDCIRVRNYAEYHRTRGTNSRAKEKQIGVPPSFTTFTTKKTEDKDSSEQQKTVAPEPAVSDPDLSNFSLEIMRVIRECIPSFSEAFYPTETDQRILRAQLCDQAWWAALQTSVPDLTPDMLRSDFADIYRWYQDNPAKRKTAKGFRRFLGSWIIRRKDSRANGRPAVYRSKASASEIDNVLDSMLSDERAKTHGNPRTNPENP